MRRSAQLLLVLLILPCSSFLACTAATPPEVTIAHEKELEIIQSLRSSHLALVDSFVDEKIAKFEEFFFETYSPVYQNNWKGEFLNKMGRDYDEEQDFAILSNDLVAEYQELAEPIEQTRAALKAAISQEYSNVTAIHTSVGGWIKSIEDLSNAQRDALNAVLGQIKPGLTIDQVETEVAGAIDKIQSRIDQIDRIKQSLP